MTDAPVCHVSVDQVIDQPPVQQLPAIPQVNDPNDMSGIIAAINGLTAFVNMLAGRMNQPGPVGPPGAAGRPGAPPKTATGRFTEVNRSTKEVVIKSSTDPDVSVTVLRIQNLTMRDNVTGETWTWAL